MCAMVAESIMGSLLYSTVPQILRSGLVAPSPLYVAPLHGKMERMSRGSEWTLLIVFANMRSFATRIVFQFGSNSLFHHGIAHRPTTFELPIVPRRQSCTMQATGHHFRR
jgi:hypothetical protein